MEDTTKFESMSLIDNFWLNMDEPTNLMAITGLYELEDKMEYSLLQELVEKRMLCYDRFRQRVTWPTSKMGPAYWETDPNFDIKSHLIRVGLPSPANKKTLEKMISDLTIVPLDPKKPLWQVHLIENYGKGSVLFIRVHHCIADGIALIRLLLSLTDIKPNPGLKEASIFPTETRKTYYRPDSKIISSVLPIAKALRASINTSAKLGDVFLQETIKTLAHPAHAVNIAKAIGNIALESSASILKLLLLPKDSKTLFKAERIGVAKSICWSEPVLVEKIKSIGKDHGATINDVLMSAVSGALRKYLIEKKDDLSETEFRVMIPVNVRELVPKVELGNKFSLIMLDLPLHIEDPVKRLIEIKKRMDELKDSPEAFVGYQGLKVLGLTPNKIGKKGAKVFSNKVSAILSNVPGPRMPLYFADNKIKNILFWVPRIGKTTLGISLMSYDGNVQLGIATDSSIAPDPEKITDYFEKEFKEIHKNPKKNKKEKINN